MKYRAEFNHGPTQEFDADDVISAKAYAFAQNLDGRMLLNLFELNDDGSIAGCIVQDGKEEATDNRIVNVIIGSAGGNASKSAKTYKISIPSAWAKEMQVTEGSRAVLMSFDGSVITIKRMQ